MKEFDVRVQEVLTQVISIKAESEEEAIEKAKAMYEDQEIFLTYEDMSDMPTFDIDNTIAQWQQYLNATS